MVVELFSGTPKKRLCFLPPLTLDEPASVLNRDLSATPGKLETCKEALALPCLGCCSDMLQKRQGRACGFNVI